VIRSRKYLDGAKGESCKVRIAGVCKDDRSTVISAHIRDRHAGRGQKASDLSTADCCFLCHDVLDRRAKMPDGEYISEADWLFYALRGLQETLEARFDLGLLIVPVDAETLSSERPVKPRKPKSERKAIQSRSSFPKQSRGWRKREE
jgi:hypothetical protein